MEDEQNSRRRTTLEDVARLAKVSTSAVSRTFTDGASVSKKTRLRVMRAADQLGYRPNMLARSLMTGRSALIALISNAFNNPYVMAILDTFTIELQNRRLRPLVFNLTGSHDPIDTVTLISQYQVDGVLIASSTLDPQYAEKLTKAGIPTVIAFGGGLGQSSTSAAFVDNVEGGRLAAKEFVDRGYRQLGFLGGPQNSSTTQDRLRGFQQYFAEQGLKPVPVEYSGEYSHEAGVRGTIRMLQSQPKLDGLFCADDLIGIGALDALKFELGRKVPDFGVIGFNDLQMSSWPSYQLSTLRTHTDEVVLCAIDMLESRIENGPRPVEKRIIGCEIVVRRTLKPLASS